MKQQVGFKPLSPQSNTLTTWPQCHFLQILRSAHPQHNYVSFSQLTSQLESCAYGSTPFHSGLDWGLLPIITASMKWTGRINAERSTF